VTRARLVAGTTELDLAGRTVQTWGFRGDTIRPRAGDILEVELRNELPESTTIHWHGIAIRNDMDGVHDLTQPAVGPGETFTYRFLVPHAGTNFFHPHTGLQLDRALYEPLVIDDPDDAGDYDADHTLVLDDWLDGTPEDAFASIRAGMDGMDMDGMDMGGMDMGGMAESDLLGGHAGDVAYRTHLINRRPLEDRPTFDAPAGGRTRLRLINAASDTAYRVAANFSTRIHRRSTTRTRMSGHFSTRSSSMLANASMPTAFTMARCCFWPSTATGSLTAREETPACTAPGCTIQSETSLRNLRRCSRRAARC
jgi:FtsP/CotA-like multicopper oxidase with cupredoxin domain